MPKTAKLNGPKAKTAKPPAAPPAVDNGPDRETYHFYLGQIEAQNKLCADARQERKRVRRLATDAGLNLARMDLLLKRRDNEADTAEEWLGGLIREAVWMGMTPETQLDLFEHAKPRPAEQTAEEQGYVEGLEARAPEGDRYSADSPLGQARLRGWHRGQDVIKERWLNQQQAE